MKITPVPDAYAPPLHRALNIKVGIGDNDEGVAWIEVDREVHFGSRWAHGGMAATLSDIASGIVIARRFEDPMRALDGTIELKVNFLRKVVEGDMTAIARLLHLGKRIAVTDVDVMNKDQLVAKALGTFMLHQPDA
ncbi:MAG TPA: PaaI family thioesterase [Actinomycetota bacterium]